MATYFVKGDILVASRDVDVCGYKKGDRYEVVAVNELRTFAGNFVTYALQREGEGSGTIKMQANAHLLFTKVPYKVCSCCKREFSREEWARLDYVGQMDDDVEVIELRNCPCGPIPATLAVVVGPSPSAVQS
jgi:hypothetical protein